MLNLLYTLFGPCEVLLPLPKPVNAPRSVQALFKCGLVRNLLKEVNAAPRYVGSRVEEVI